jgi:hypothetical protein
MAVEYRNLKKRTFDNAPGVKKKAYAAPRSWFEDPDGLKIPTPGATPGPGDSYRITATHAFKEGKGFLELYGTLATGEITAETVGERDSRTTNPQFVFQNPGLDAFGIEFAEQAKNDEWIILIPGLDGLVYQMGQDGLECDLVPSRGSGKVDGGYKGHTYTAESFGPIFVYEGDITLFADPV